MERRKGQGRRGGRLEQKENSKKNGRAYSSPTPNTHTYSIQGPCRLLCVMLLIWFRSLTGCGVQFSLLDVHTSFPLILCIYEDVLVVCQGDYDEDFMGDVGCRARMWYAKGRGAVYTDVGEVCHFFSLAHLWQEWGLPQGRPLRAILDDVHEPD